MNIGIIGFGRRLRSLTAELVRTRTNVRIAAVSDPHPAARETALSLFGPDLIVEVEYDDLLSHPEIDWVMIGSPNHLHREQAIAAMDAGKHVFCEKPLGISLEECLQIREAQARTGVKFFIGFTLRYSPHYMRIKKLLEDGQIGRLVSMEFNETLGFNHGGYIHQDWRRHTRLAGTHLLEKCCHDIDVANWLTDSLPTRVASFGGLNFFTAGNKDMVGQLGPDPVSGRPAFMNMVEASDNPFTAEKDIIDNQVAILEYQSGVRATFHTNCCAAQPERRTYLVGTEGTIQADMVTGVIRLRRLGWDEPTTVYNSADGLSTDGHGGADPQLISWLSHCMLDDSRPKASIDEGLKSAITCFAIDQAMRDGKLVDVTQLWDAAGIHIF